MARSPVPVVEPARNDAAGRSLAALLVRSLRPGQWSKNLIVFAGLIFSERHLLLQPPAVGRAAVAFLVFCAAAGVVYLINDVRDREADRHHPVKCRRPIASGALSPATALAAAAARA